MIADDTNFSSGLALANAASGGLRSSLRLHVVIGFSMHACLNCNDSMLCEQTLCTLCTPHCHSICDQNLTVALLLFISVYTYVPTV
jgi:hypothetical protein